MKVRFVKGMSAIGSLREWRDPIDAAALLARRETAERPLVHVVLGKLCFLSEFIG